MIGNFAGAGISITGSPRTNVLDNTISMSSGRTGVAGILVEGSAEEELPKAADQGLYIRYVKHRFSEKV